MTYILTDGGSNVVTYPYNIGLLRRDNPNVSFPANPSIEELADWNVFPVTEVSQSSIDTLTEYITEGTPILSEGTWTQVWTINTYTPEEQTTVYNQFVEQAIATANALFEATDKYITKALTSGLELHPDLIAYRAALLEITTLTGYPNNIIWPTEPTTYFVGTGETQVASIKANTLHVTGTLTLDNPISSDKTWTSPNETVWTIKEVAGGKSVIYTAPQAGYLGTYTALNTSTSTPSSHETVTVGSAEAVNYISVPFASLSYLQSIYVNGSSITVGENTYTLDGSYGYGGEGPITLMITSTATFNDGEIVTINGQSYQTDAFSVQLNGDLIASDDPDYINHLTGAYVIIDGTNHYIDGYGISYGPMGQQTLSVNINTPAKLEPNEYIELQLMIPEVANLWINPEVDFGISPEELRGYSLDYHMYSFDSGTFIGKIIVAVDDNPRVSHVYSASGGGDTSAVDIETPSDSWEDNKGLLFKRTDGENAQIFIQWSGKAFYSPEWYD